MHDNIFPIWKPIDWTSFDVVKKVKKQLGIEKVGHTGTLDPFAEGILLICTGNYTKKTEEFMDMEKEYVATINLGTETDTLDITGEIINTKDVTLLDKNIVSDTLSNFIGTIDQVPPAYSAVKINGQPLYKYARSGIFIRKKPRKIKIYNIELLDVINNLIKIKVTSGRGVYIRSLAYDISVKLNNIGYLQNLQRTRIGKYCKKDCLDINGISKWMSTQAFQN